MDKLWVSNMQIYEYKLYKKLHTALKRVNKKKAVT